MADINQSGSDRLESLCLGDTVAHLADFHGLLIEDLAIAVAAVLGNIGGPRAGLKDHSGRRIEPGINVLQLSSRNPRETALLDQLLHPLRTVQRSLRERARQLPAKLVNAFTFGFDDPLGALPKGILSGDESWQRELRCREELQRVLEHGGSKCSDNDVEIGRVGTLENDGELTRTRRETFLLHPTFLVEGICCKHMSASLADTFERQAFVFDPKGVFFESLGGRGRSRQEESWFVAGLLKGVDIPYERHSPAQGHGTLERSRVRLWSCLKDEELDRLAQIDESPAFGMVDQCLCWQARRAKGVVFDPHGFQGAWRTYCKAVREVMNARAGGRGPVYELNPNQLKRYADLQGHYLDELECVASGFTMSLSEFHDLPARVAWALIHINGGAAQQGFLSSAFHVAHCAVRQHVSLVSEARERSRSLGLRKVMDSLVAALERHGECPQRKLLRSLSVQRKEVVLPALQTLISDGRVVQSESRRYRLVPGAGRN